MGQKKFEKIEFVCPHGTVWEQDKTMCNFESAVKKLSCKKKENVTERNGKIEDDKNSLKFPTATELPILLTTYSELSCPVGRLTEEQILLICPSGFRRHPKYCNLFYQCTMTRKINAKIVILKCPEDTIFDDTRIQCVKKKKMHKVLDGYTNCQKFKVNVSSGDKHNSFVSKHYIFK